MISYYLVIPATFPYCCYSISVQLSTACHRLLLTRLSEIGISGAALSWFSSNLTNRQHFISMHKYKSLTVLLKQGVPQGSVLGPFLFIIYIMPIGQIMRRHGFQYHCYAEDIQIYTACQPNCINQITSLSACVSELKTWLTLNFLNLTKTEIL